MQQSCIMFVKDHENTYSHNRKMTIHKQENEYLSADR